MARHKPARRRDKKHRPSRPQPRVPDQFSRLHLVHLADLRNRGQTWDQTAEEAAKPYTPSAGDELRARLEADPEWRTVLRQSRPQLFADAMAHALHTLRVLVRDEDPVMSARVANHLARIGETFIRHRKN